VLKRAYETLYTQNRLDKPLEEYRGQWEKAAFIFELHKIEFSQLRNMHAQEIMECLREGGIVEFGVLKRIVQAVRVFHTPHEISTWPVNTGSKTTQNEIQVNDVMFPVPTNTPSLVSTFPVFAHILLPQVDNSLLNCDMKSFTKHTDRKIVVQVLALANHLTVPFSGVCKIRLGQYLIRFYNFFSFFNIYRYFRKLAPIKHDSVHELFRSSKSHGTWTKKVAVDGQFTVTWKQAVPPMELTGTALSPEDDKTLTLLKQLQYDEQKKNIFSTELCSSLITTNPRK